jgi:hypothetical protein
MFQVKDLVIHLADKPDQDGCGASMVLGKTNEPCSCCNNSTENDTVGTCPCGKVVEGVVEGQALLLQQLRRETAEARL